MKFYYIFYLQTLVRIQFERSLQNIFLFIFYFDCLNRDLTETFYPFRYRDIPIFILLFLSINFLKFDKKTFITPILIGFLSFLSLFWSLDRGIYSIVALVFLFILSIFKRRYLGASLLIIGFSISSFLIIILFGVSEIKNFYINTLNIIKYFDLYAGSSYPTIFDFKNNHSSRGTLNLLIIIMNGFLLSIFLLKSSLKLTDNSKIYFVFLYFVSILLYKSALSVPDSYHMKQSIFLSKVVLISKLFYLLLNNKYL